jgi:uncharacterized Zn-finger protein
MNTQKKPIETITVPADTDQVCCDGGSGPLGHPLVFYTFDGKPNVTCGYCGRFFVKDNA